MISTRSKDAKQGNESYSSNEADSTIKTEDSETSAKQGQTKTRKQLTLQPSSRSTKKDSVAKQGGFGILVLGTSHLGPRTLLYIIKNPWKSMMKVSQSTASLEQNRAQLITSALTS